MVMLGSPVGRQFGHGAGDGAEFLDQTAGIGLGLQRLNADFRSLGQAGLWRQLDHSILNYARVTHSFSCPTATTVAYRRRLFNQNVPVQMSPPAPAHVTLI